jgi:exonuclease VII small subunit
MFPRFLSRALIVLGALFLVLSVSGIAAIWIFRTRVTNEALARLESIDQQLSQAQSDLDNGKSELQRTLRIVDAAQTSLDSLKQQLVTAKQLTDQVNGVLNGDLIPGLQGVRGKIDQLRGTIQNLRNSL